MFAVNSWNSPAEITIVEFIINEEKMKGWWFDGDNEVWMELGNKRNKYQVMKHLKAQIEEFVNERGDDDGFYRLLDYRTEEYDAVDYEPTAKELQDAEQALRIELVAM